MESATFAVFGIPLRFESDAREVIDAADALFGPWRGVAMEEAWAGRAPVRIRITLALDEGGPGRQGMRIREPGRLAVRAPGIRARADVRRRAAVARVSPEVVADRERFRGGVLEMLALWLLTGLDREPLHAAAVVRGGTALLLAGPSGVGKSTLTYAALRSGLRVLSEDTVFLQESPVPRVWGLGGFVHLHPGAARFFPELRTLPPRRRANGDLKLAIHTPPVTAGIERAGICLLARGDAAGVARLAPDAVEREVAAGLDAGFDRFAATIGRRVRRVAEGGAWRLTLSPSPADAVPLLHRMLDEVEGEPGSR
ncbi:MAG TPA: hypothetical protein VHG08_21740 [Longimicrobium sp.]|nr:hypothetical protein [Longimicrobium sp.]